MQAQLELYKTWAPDQAMWTQWVKPVVFMNMKQTQLYSPYPLKKINTNGLAYDTDTIVIADLEGTQSIEAGLALAHQGYRPIPLYNSVPEPAGVKAAVSTSQIAKGLCSGAQELEQISLSKRANPVFLLDASRMKGAKRAPGTFDNRWCVVTQDLPSAGYLKKNHIRRIIVWTDKLQEDLQYILYKYQKSGIMVQVQNDAGVIGKTKIRKPQNFAVMFYRFLAVMGLARSATGGFGMIVPMPGSDSGGSGYRAG